MSSKCLFMHELPQTLAETLHIITCFAPAGRQNKLQTNISPKKFRTISFWVFFQDETTCQSYWWAVVLPKFFFSAKSFPSPRWWWRSFIFDDICKSQHTQTYMKYLHQCYRRCSTLFSPDHRFLHLKPSTCHHQNPPNQPKLPSQNMLNKNPFEELHQKGTNIPTPKVHGQKDAWCFLDKKYESKARNP